MLRLTGRAEIVRQAIVLDRSDSNGERLAVTLGPAA